MNTAELDDAQALARPFVFTTRISCQSEQPMTLTESMKHILVRIRTVTEA